MRHKHASKISIKFLKNWMILSPNILTNNILKIIESTPGEFNTIAFQINFFKNPEISLVSVIDIRKVSYDFQRKYSFYLYPKVVFRSLRTLCLSSSVLLTLPLDDTTPS